jgi:hypothetical protein
MWPDRAAESVALKMDLNRAILISVLLFFSVLAHATGRAS